MAALYDDSIYKYKQYNQYKTINCGTGDWISYDNKNNYIIDYGTSAATDTSTIIELYNTTATSDTCTTWGSYKWHDPWAENTYGWKNSSCEWVTPKKSPETKLKEIIAARQAPVVHTRERWRLHRSTQQCPNEREARARQTLRRVIGDEKFKGFLRNGFVTVRNPKSGKSYQIFPGHGITCVFENGEMTERLCVVLNGDFPPTDSIIMRYLMILNNEEQFRSIAINHAINHAVTQRQKKIVTPDERSLSEIFRELKAA
tara:strand:- start:14868 stop:15641 length:774 start_codon:yes stop_codon:yes gene_type:complete